MFTFCAGQYLSTCVSLPAFFQHSSRCCRPAAESDARTHSLTSGCDWTLQEDLGSRLNMDVLWYGCNQRLNFGSLNQNQEIDPGLCLKLVKNKTKQICRFLVFFYHIFTTVGTQTSTCLSLGCDKQGSVCPCVRRVHYQANPSPSVLSTSPKGVQ